MGYRLRAACLHMLVKTFAKPVRWKDSAHASMERHIKSLSLKAFLNLR